MKKLLLTLTAVTVSALTMYGQGRVFFNNEISPLAGPITVGALHTEGNTGDLLGTAYSIQLLWAPQGVYANNDAGRAAFLAAMLGSSAAATFEGDTPAGGAGFFNGGTVPNPAGTSMPGGTYTMVARAWFNNGQFATYDAAVGHNQGYSSFFDIVATVPNTGPNNTPVAAFSVGIVPEPSTFALAGLGAATLLLFRRRK